MRGTERPETGTISEREAGAVASIDRAIRDAFIYLEALDRRTLAGITPRLTTAQYHALAALALTPTQSLGALATRLLCDKANASGLVDRLSALGLVDRVRDPHDRRRVALSLTPAGQEALAQARHARAAALLRALAPLEVAGLTTMTEALQRLVALLQSAVEDE